MSETGAENPAFLVPEGARRITDQVYAIGQPDPVYAARMARAIMEWYLNYLTEQEAEHERSNAQ
jgi:hypothetical protein